MTYLSTDLSMASLNEAKVGNLDELMKEAQTAIQSHLIDNEELVTIQSALNTINSKQDYEITPDLVAEVDTTINKVGDVVVSRNGNVSINVTGTESFGLTLTPSQWRKSRVEGCEALIEELTKSIKRWTSQFSDKIVEIFTGNRYTISSLKERLGELEKNLTYIETLRDPNALVTIPSGINKSFKKNNRYLTTNTDFPKALGAEIGFAGMVIKTWMDESVKYKNTIIRYFGNKGKGDLLSLRRQHPKLFSKKWFMDDDVMDLFYWTTPDRLLGEAAISFAQKHDNAPVTIVELVKDQTLVGYDFVSVDQVNTRDKDPDLNIVPFGINTLELIKGQIEIIISTMESMNQKGNDFDTDSRDVKDVMGTLKDSDENELLECFSKLLTHYQDNTMYIQSSFIRYLGQLASHLITFMFIQMEAYDGA